jgi:FMN phosphatase YigB (HAD superfamily)
MGDRVNPARVTRVMHQAVAAMFANTDVTRTLENILLDALQESVSITAEQYAEYLELFCENDLEALRPLVKGHSLSPCLVESCLARGWQVVLATNPIFPRPVIDARITWGQLEEKAFHHVTSYETAHFCKPNPAFFEEILARLQVPAGACLMVGNDTLHDLSASQVGMQTCLLTPWSIKRPGVQFKADWQGRHDELLALIAPESSALASWSSRPD